MGVTMVRVHIPIEDIVEEHALMAQSEDYEARAESFRKFDMVQFRSDLEKRFEDFFSVVFTLTRGGEPKTIQEDADYADAYDAFRKQRALKKWVKVFKNMPKAGEDFVFVVGDRLFQPTEKPRVEVHLKAKLAGTPQAAVTDAQIAALLEDSKVKLPSELVSPDKLEINVERFQITVPKPHSELVARLMKEAVSAPETDDKGQPNKKRIFRGTDHFMHYRALEAAEALKESPTVN